jgi:tetratricopeptide (TPR) repeat protein
MIIELAHLQAFYLHKPDEGFKRVKEINDYQRGKPQDIARAKMEMADILLLKGDLWEPSLLYGQVEKEFKNDLLGQEAKFRNAKLSFYRGEFDWAQAQMSVLKASTSKLIANDALALSLLILDNTGLDMDTTFEALNMYARADLLNYQNQLDASLQTLDSLENKFPFHSVMDEVLFKKAEISLKKADFEKAAQYYDKIVTNYGTDILADDALFRLGDLYERKFNNTEKALEYYREIMLNHKSSMYVIEARKRYQQLKGEKVN